MKITFVNTTDTRGGAAIAAFRLFKLIHQKYPETRMLVREKLTGTHDVHGLNNNVFQKTLIQFRFFLERISYILRAKSKETWFAFSPANTGQRIEKSPEIISADIIHLHWINGGFLSLKSIHHLIQTGKPIVWTLHDMWAFTGGCHYPGSCTNYIQNCGNCNFLRFPSSDDLSFRVIKEKQDIFLNHNISFVAVSNWMAENARKSGLIGKSRIVVIPNPIDTEIYKSADRSTIRTKLGLPLNKFLILSGAANLNDKRKGFIYLIKALQRMKEDRAEISELFGLITFGKSSEVYNSPIDVYPQSYLKDDESIAMLYQAADVFVLPTLEDNLPSTVMESLACETPVVAFNTGGIPDMIDHKSNGYLAELKNVNDLINGITWVESHPEIYKIKQNCRRKVESNFSPKIVAEKYINLYRSLIG